MTRPHSPTCSDSRPLVRCLTFVLGTACALGLGLGAGLVGGASGATETPPAAPGERPVIVQVGGDAANGFDLTYTDGSTLSPPTDSEARAECSEYDTRVARVRCRVEVRTWYRDLGDLQRSLAWVRAHDR